MRAFMQNQQPADHLRYQGCLAMIEATSGSYQETKQVWFGRKDFSGLGAMLIQPSAKTFVQAGAIAMRTMGDPVTAFRHWRDIAPVTAILAEGIALRAALTPAECRGLDNVDFVSCDLLYVQYGLLFSGLRGELSKVRHYHDLPFVRMRGDGETRPNSLSLEARIMFAAWEGDQPQVEALAQSLEAHYKSFKLSPVYTALWKAVAKRDSMELDQLLAEAEAAYRKSARRKVDDPWGGDKSLNEAMFDIYTTSVLKIARDVGMAWDYGNQYTRQIWPLTVIESWEQAGGA